jgi:aconitate hydratase
MELSDVHRCCPAHAHTHCRFKFEPPKGEELPPSGFDLGEDTYVSLVVSAPLTLTLPLTLAAVCRFAPPPESGAADIDVDVSPDSDRLQLLAPFAAWDGKDIERASVSRV